MAAISKYNVKNILVEWSPKRWGNLHNLDRGTQVLEQLNDLGYTVYHYELRMEYPQSGLQVKEVPVVGKIYEIPRDKFAHLNEFLATAGYGEANLWIVKNN
jgi:gamma-glutamylcyclotransferase (GGCT)/AIG2-like uncharacterized protein YtfP